MPTAKRLAALRAKVSLKATPKKTSSRRQAAAHRSPAPSRRSAAKPPSKHAQALTLLRTAEGISVADLAAALSWQTHSVRGFLSGTVKKKLMLSLRQQRTEGQPTRYSLPEVP